MRLMIDAQLPMRLASALADLGRDVVHTSQLPLGNRTPDIEVASFADSQGPPHKPHDLTQSGTLQPASGAPVRRIPVRSTGRKRSPSSCRDHAHVVVVAQHCHRADVRYNRQRRHQEGTCTPTTAPCRQTVSESDVQSVSRTDTFCPHPPRTISAQRPHRQIESEGVEVPSWSVVP